MHTNSVNSRLRGRQSNKPRRELESGRKRSYQYLPKPLSRTAGTLFFSDSVPFLTYAHNSIRNSLSTYPHYSTGFSGPSNPCFPQIRSRKCQSLGLDIMPSRRHCCHISRRRSCLRSMVERRKLSNRTGCVLVVVKDGRILNEFEWEVGGWSFSLGFTVAMTLRNTALLLLLSSQPISQYYSFKTSFA